MPDKTKLRLATIAAALVAVNGAGVGVAATQLSPSEESDAMIEDAAKQLGVDASALDQALTQALQNRIDAAVADGRLTEEQGEELKEQLGNGELPLVGLGPGGHGGLGHGHHLLSLGAAAGYLDLDREELRTALEAGQTLAEVAEAQKKSVEGLVDALVAEAREPLDEAVPDGLLTEAERTERLAEVEERLGDAVQNGLRFRHGPFGRSAPPHSGDDV